VEPDINPGEAVSDNTDATATNDFAMAAISDRLAEGKARLLPELRPAKRRRHNRPSKHRRGDDRLAVIRALAISELVSEAIVDPEIVGPRAPSAHFGSRPQPGTTTRQGWDR
jgi:hypothetical protein